MRHYFFSVGTKLLRSVDLAVDDSYLLSQVQQSALHRCIFPLGEFHRDVVHNIASSTGLMKFIKPKVIIKNKIIRKTVKRIIIVEYSETSRLNLYIHLHLIEHFFMNFMFKI